MSSPPSQEPTDWAVWDKVNEGLDQERKNRVLPIWFWLPACFMVGLLGYYLGNMNNDSQSMSTAELLHDTIYIDKLSVIHDTVFQNQIIEKWRTKEIYRSQRSYAQIDIDRLRAQNQALSNDLRIYKMAIANHPISTNSAFSDLPGIREYLANSDLNSSINNSTLPSLAGTLDDRSLLTINPLDSDNKFDLLDYRRMLVLAKLTKEDMIRMKEKKSLLDLIIPDYLNIGASFDLPEFTTNSSGQFGLGNALGFNAELLFSRRFSLVGGIHFGGNNVNIANSLEAEEYPQPAQILPGETFKKLSISQSVINIPLMAKYKLTTERILNHYITLGATFSRTSQVEYKYEYTPSSGVGETYYEVKSNDKPSITYGRLGYGLEYKLNSNFNLFGESYLSIPVVSTSSEVNDYSGLGFRFGIYYRI